MRACIAILLLSFLATAANAQNLLKGSVYDGGSSIKLPNVFIKDMNSKEMSLTDKNGNFSIKVAKGHVLIFSLPTYTSDTLFIVDFLPKKIRLTNLGISINEVNVSARKLPFDPHTDYRQVYEKAKVYPLSPTTWFGREARNARRLKKYFKHEVEEREIDQVFSKAYVSSLIPLRGKELDNFMTMYRPDYSFVKDNTERTVALYVNDSYKKYQALPAEKRNVAEFKE